MRKFIFSLFAACCFFTITKAQNEKPEVLIYDWGKPYFETDRFENKDTVAVHVLRSNTIVEYTYENGELNRYLLFHEKVKINNNSGLEQYKTQRFYGDIIAVKARFIGKDGKVIEVNQSDIKTLEDEDGYYKLLAIEGAEVGGIIEYYYSRKASSNLSGSYIFQSRVPKSNVSMSIISPVNLQFTAKSYNGCPELTETVDSLKEIRILSFSADEIPALENEIFSFYKSHLQRVEYSFAFNSVTKTGISSVLGNELKSYHYFCHTFDRKELKSMQPVWKKMNIQKEMDEETKIRIIENYIKTNFQWRIENSSDGMNIALIPGILKTKYANTSGYLRILAASFKHFDIPFELVLTCERTSRFFDKDFKGRNFLDEILIYFPSSGFYLDPKGMNRLGHITNDYLGNNGMFLKEVEASGIASFMPYYKQIPENDYEKSTHATYADIKLNTKDFSATYTVKHQFSGYTASLQPSLYYIDDEQRKKIVEGIIVNELLPDKLLSWKVENQEPIDWYRKPLSIKAEMQGSSLLSKGGDDILVQIGVLIGQQAEMYQEKERKLPFESDNTRLYVREITLEIPDGYTVSNPEATKIKKELLMDGNVEAFFYSDYTISGNQITVTSSEGYKRMIFPRSFVKEYTDVINAAADFNKITLILVPEKQ